MLALITIFAAASVSTADIRPLLRDQGFRGPLNGRETIQYAGAIRQGRDSYQIYSYHGVFRAAVVDHGVNWIIVIHNGRTLFGSYHVPMPVECSVRRQQVLCTAEGPGRVIQFTKSGPPYEIWFDGELVRMEFGNRLKAYRCNERPCQELGKWTHR